MAITLAFALRTGLVFFFFEIFAMGGFSSFPDFSLPKRITPLEANRLLFKALTKC